MKFNYAKFRNDFITKRKIDRNISLTEVAEEIGDISVSTLSRLEGKSKIDMDTFAKVCGWMGAKPDSYFLIIKK